MKSHDTWPWSRSLAALRADHAQVFRVRRILFGMVRDRCGDAGLDEGTEFRCRSRSADRVVIEFSGGGTRTLELPYAWFIQCEPVGEKDQPATS